MVTVWSRNFDGTCYGGRRVGLLAGQHVPVGVERERHRRVTKPLRHEPSVGARGEQVRGVRVPQVVESDPGQLRPCAGVLERLGDAPGLYGPPSGETNTRPVWFHRSPATRRVRCCDAWCPRNATAVAASASIVRREPAVFGSDISRRPSTSMRLCRTTRRAWSRSTASHASPSTSPRRIPVSPCAPLRLGGDMPVAAGADRQRWGAVGRDAQVVVIAEEQEVPSGRLGDGGAGADRRRGDVVRSRIARSGTRSSGWGCRRRARTSRRGRRGAGW